MSTEQVASARSSLEAARAALDSAATSARAARAQFLASASESSEAALESAERAERKASRFVEAREAQLREAEETQRVAERAEAETAVARLASEHRNLEAEVKRGIEEGFPNVCEQLEALIAKVERTITAAQALFARATRIARPYGLRVDMTALDVTTVRTAVGLHLARSWQAPKGRGAPEFDAFFTALGRFNLPGSGTDIAQRLRLAISEFLAATEAPELADWLRLEMNPVNPLSATHHARVRAAARLLAELQEVDP